MENNNLQAICFERLISIFPTVDFIRLDKSCNSVEDGYAKEILKMMHDAFVEVYGMDYLGNVDYDFVELPAVIKGRDTGHIGLGIVSLNMQSSGEHCNTIFVTPLGTVDQGDVNVKADGLRYIANTYIPYDYWYTISIECDHHVDFDNVPERVADMLNACYPDQPD